MKWRKLHRIESKSFKWCLKNLFNDRNHFGSKFSIHFCNSKYQYREFSCYVQLRLVFFSNQLNPMVNYGVSNIFDLVCECRPFNPSDESSAEKVSNVKYLLMWRNLLILLFVWEKANARDKSEDIKLLPAPNEVNHCTTSKVAIKRNQMIINFARNRLTIGFRCSWCDVDKFYCALRLCALNFLCWSDGDINSLGFKKSFL